MTLTSEQRTKIQQTVLAGNNVPRVNNVNFALNVGVSVPRSVRVVLPFSAVSRLSCDKASPALRFSGAWLLPWQGRWTAREAVL